jgi:hypothetical protein
MNMIQQIVQQISEQANPKPLGTDHATVETVFFTQFSRLTAQSCRRTCR